MKTNLCVASLFIILLPLGASALSQMKTLEKTPEVVDSVMTTRLEPGRIYSGVNPRGIPCTVQLTGENKSRKLVIHKPEDSYEKETFTTFDSSLINVKNKSAFRITQIGQEFTDAFDDITIQSANAAGEAMNVNLSLSHGILYDVYVDLMTGHPWSDRIEACMQLK